MTTTPDFFDDTVTWRKVSAKPSLYHVDNGNGRAVCMPGRVLEGPEAPADFVPYQGLFRRADGTEFFPAKGPVCMRCKNWLDARGRWGPRG